MKPIISPPAILISSQAISAWNPKTRRLLRHFKRFRFSSDMGYLSIPTLDTGKTATTAWALTFYIDRRFPPIDFSF